MNIPHTPVPTYEFQDLQEDKSQWAYRWSDPGSPGARAELGHIEARWARAEAQRAEKEESK